MEWMAKVRLPGSRTLALGLYVMLLLLVPGIFNHFSNFYPTHPLTPHQKCVLNPLACPSDWLWKSSPNTYVMGPIPQFSLQAQPFQGNSKTSWAWWKNKGQEDVCA